MFTPKNLEAFVCQASSALELKLIAKEEDFFDDAAIFRPEMTHQVFGERENIFGYKNLKIKLYYSHDDLYTYAAMEYDAKIDPRTHQKLKPDDVVKALSAVVPPGFTRSRDEFLARISDPKRCFTPYGEHIGSYPQEGNKNVTFEIYKANIHTPGFLQYHARLQTFIIWYIDASSFIDVEDEKWTFYLLFSREVVNGVSSYTSMGYSTVYSFYAFPDKSRYRISQMLILPPFQRKGHGARLLQAIYDDLVPSPSVRDILVEDPSDDFQVMRDYVDCRNILASEGVRSPTATGDLFGQEVMQVCQKLKLSKKQARRVCEILQLRVTDRGNPDQYTKYRLWVKSRLNEPYQRQKKDLEKLQPYLSPVEVATMKLHSEEEQRAQLHETYKLLEEDYLKVIEKLAVTSGI
ncbi:hypothetical protein EMCRGX_G005982 [Ephydatia muelleri]